MYQIYISEHFKRQAKRLVRKYPSFSDDIVAALKAFSKEQSVSLGSNAYKIRIGSKCASRGKSAAFRAIALLVEVRSIIAPLVVYAKSDRASISRQEILYHASVVEQELSHIGGKVRAVVPRA